MPIVAALVFAYAQTKFWGDHSRRTIWAFRGSLVAAFFAAFIGVGSAWTSWFEYKQEQVDFYLHAVGGHPFPGPIRMYHHFWHPVWCGLGDFGDDKGYKWEDVTALAYARPILQQRYGEYVPDPTFGVAP